MLAFIALRAILKRNGRSVGPILTLSYKNHALDEFLLDVLRQEESLKRGGALVRLGKKSEHIELENYTERSCAAESKANKELMACIKVMKDNKSRQQRWVRSRSIQGDVTGDVLYEALLFACLAGEGRFQYVDPDACFQLLQAFNDEENHDSLFDDFDVCEKLQVDAEHWRQFPGLRQLLTQWIQGRNPPERCQAVVMVNANRFARCLRYAKLGSCFCADLHACGVNGCCAQRDNGYLLCREHRCCGAGGTCPNAVTEGSPFCSTHCCALCLTSESLEGCTVCEEHCCTVRGCHQPMLHATDAPFCIDHCCEPCWERNCITLASLVKDSARGGVLCAAHQCVFPGCLQRKEDGGDLCADHRCRLCAANVDDSCSESKLCAVHRCMHQEDGEASCAQPKVELRDGRRSIFCRTHVCRGCIQLKSPSLAAPTIAPRYHCQEHVLCIEIDGRGEQCTCLVAPNTEYCSEHDPHLKQFCAGVTGKGNPCRAKRQGKDDGQEGPWFCPAHKDQRDSPDNAGKRRAVVRIRELREEDVVIAVAHQPPPPPVPRQLGDPRSFKRLAECTHPECERLGLVGALDDGGWTCVHHSQRAIVVAPAVETANAGSERAAATEVVVEGLQPLVLGPVSQCGSQVSVKGPALPAGPAESPHPIGRIEFVDDGRSDDDDGGNMNHGLDPDEWVQPVDDEDDENDQVRHYREIYESDNEDDDNDRISIDDDDVVDAGHRRGGAGGPLNQSFDPVVELDATDDWSWWGTTHEERLEVARRFIGAMIEQLRLCILKAEGYVAIARQRKAEAAAHALKNAVVIGGTIVGAARRLPALRAANPFAIVVEEACEVMEPTLAAVLAVESVEKLELIGDHMQLPAFVNHCWFNMATSMPSIKTSLFERLVTRSAHGRATSDSVCTVLDVQRRMRRCIADLTRGEYEQITDIQDHEVTARQRVGDRLPQRALNAFNPVRERWPSQGRQIPGVLPAIFFWNQKDNAQSRPKVGMSACNENEAKAVGSLIKHMLLCGVPKSSITVITPYQGQQRELIQQLRNLDILPRHRDPAVTDDVVRVSTVDRFQGDENDIIILSLVRTKPGNAFVTLLNRFIVATSRARLGFYIVGSTSAVVEDPSDGRSSRRDGKHWQTFLDRLQRPDETRCDSFEGGRLGDELPICCPCHPARSQRLISSDPAQRDKAFPQVANWHTFCAVPCEKALKCGHKCGLPCHAGDPDRHQPKCPVELDRPCEHHEDIPLVCNTLSLSATPRPDETVLQAALREWKCDVVSSYPRPTCDHSETLPCYRHERIRRGEEMWPACQQPVIDYIHPVCGHVFTKLTCDVRSKYVLEPPRCRRIVTRTLVCGHEVDIACWEQDRCDQMDCKKDVNCPRPRCGHSLPTRCFTATDLSRLWSLSGCVGVESLLRGKPVVVHGGGYGPDEDTFMPDGHFPQCKQEAYFQRSCGHMELMKCCDAFTEAAKPAQSLKACAEKVRIDCIFCQQPYEVPCSLRDQLSRGCPTQRFYFEIKDDLRVIREDIVSTASASLDAAERAHWKLQAKHMCSAAGQIGIRRSCDPSHIETVSCKRLVDLILGQGGPLKQCQTMIERELDCQRHSIRQRCFERRNVAPFCSAIVNESFTFPQCGHVEVIAKCGDLLARRNTPVDQLRCYQAHQTNHVRCGHRVQVSCYQRKVVETWAQAGHVLPPADDADDASMAEVSEDELYCEPCADAPACRADVAFRRTCGHVETLPCADAFTFTRRTGSAASAARPCAAEVTGRHLLCGHNVSWPCSVRSQLEATWQPWGTDPDAVAVRPLPLAGIGENVFMYPMDLAYAPASPPAHIATRADVACAHPVTVFFHECEHRRDVKCHEFYDSFHQQPLRCTERVTVQCPLCQGSHVYSCHELRAAETVLDDWIAARCTFQVSQHCRFCQTNVVQAACNALVVECRQQVTMQLPCSHEYRWMCGSNDVSGRDLLRSHNEATGRNPACRECVTDMWVGEMDWDVEYDALIAFGDRLVDRLLDGDEQLQVEKVPLAAPIAMDPHRTQRDLTIRFISDGIRAGRIPLVSPPPVEADQLLDYIARNYDLVFIANTAGKHADVKNVQNRFSVKDTAYGQGVAVKKLSKANLMPLLKEGGFVDVWVAAAFQGRRFEGRQPFGPLPIKESERPRINMRVKEKVDLGYTSVRVVEGAQAARGGARGGVRAAAAAAEEEDDDDVRHGFVVDAIREIDETEHVVWKSGLVVPLFVLTVRIQSSCVICGDYLPSDTASGALCPDRHLICWDCLDSYIESASSADAMAQYCDRQTGRLKCAACPLHYDGFTNAVSAPRDIGKRLLDFEAKKQLERVVGEELRQQEERLRAEFERYRRLDDEGRQVYSLVKQIREEIMNPQCPRCQTVFIDFDGCFDLTCSNERCGIHFCAWCFQNCGGNAHAHVVQCPRGNGNVYGDRRLLQRVWNDMRKEKINALLNRHPPNIRQRVIRDMQRDFDDVQLRL